MALYWLGRFPLMARRKRRHVDGFGGNSEGVVSSSSAAPRGWLGRGMRPHLLGWANAGFGVACGSCFGSGSGAGGAGWVPVAPGHEPLIR